MQGYHKLAGALHDIGSALVKRGTAMGPLVPSLVAVVPMLLFAWLFRDAAVVKGIPVITAVLVVAVLGILFDYHRHYASFAKNDPDRLQSEEYRYEMTRVQMLAAKELPEPLPADSLPLDEPKRNVPEDGMPKGDEDVSASADTDREMAR